MKPLIFILLVFSLNVACHGQTSRSIYVNGEKLSTETIMALESQYGIRMLNGKYYYDKISGFWGIVGGPTMGITIPGLPIGGPLQADAAHGNTGVFFNGMELHWQDVLNLKRLTGYVLPGRYWLDAYGNAGYEGGPALVNLWQLAQRQQSTFYRNDYTGIGAGSSGGTSYVIGKDFSVITDH